VSQLEVEAELRLVSRHAYWYRQVGVDVSDSALGRSADAFDARIYPDVRRLVGAELFPGIDNDPRVSILIGNVPGVSGYVSSADSYPRVIQPFSNEREIVYLNARSVEPGTLDFNQTLAHEFTHLAHQNVSLAEPTWIKEGLADLIASIVFPERELGSGAFFALPDLQLTTWSDGGTTVPVSARYQAASWFLRYFADRFGEENLETVARRGTGQLLGSELATDRDGRPFTELFRDWTVANLGAERSGSTVPLYQKQPRSAPPMRTMGLGQEVDDDVAQFGADYYAVDSQSSLRVDFQGDPTVPLIAARPYEGQAMWYAGRADASVSTATRYFDLAQVTTGTLTYAVWYELEKDYDFAYVSASVDGGQRWTLLDTPQMTRVNQTGNNLGVGYTGASGPDGAPVWMREAVDLTPFAGRGVLIRFSLVTDDAVSYRGVAIDDIRVDAIGYADGAEGEEAGWDLQGWSHVGAELTQPWLVTLVAFRGSNAALSRVAIDENGRGTWSSRGDPVDRAVVIVSGAAPVTSERARYRLQISRD